MLIQTVRVALILGAACLFPAQLWAASCCGGGSSSSLMLAKNKSLLAGVSFSHEIYDGFWKKNGIWVPDPAGSSLKQSRINLGLATRLNDNWQLAFDLAYVWNQSNYSHSSYKTQGLGDSTVALTYEAFDDVTCLYSIETWQDLKPAIYFSTTLMLPTGISPYDKVSNNFDITGRGFYRLDLSALFEKSVYPWSASVAFNYGYHFKRPVNREYGIFIEPYQKQLGQRTNISSSVGYTWFFNTQSMTLTGSLNYLREGHTTIAGITDSTSGMIKKGFATTLSWENLDNSWLVKASFGQAPPYNYWGQNFPSTQTFTLGVNHVFE